MLAEEKWACAILLLPLQPILLHCVKSELCGVSYKLFTHPRNTTLKEFLEFDKNHNFET